MTCIVWDGATLISDSKVTTRAIKDDVRMGAIKTHILTKPLLTSAGDKIMAVTGAGRMDIIEFYIDRTQKAANANITVEELIKNITEFSMPGSGERVDIIGVGTNAAGTETRCFHIGRSLTPVTKARAWGSASNSNKEIVDGLIAAGSLVAAHGLSSIDRDRCGLPYLEFNPLTGTVVTHHSIPDETAITTYGVLDREFTEILRRIYTKPPTRRKTK